MAFLRKLFKGVAKQKRDYPNIRQGADPLEQWQKIGELGDGSFGKVYKAEHRESGKLAALKRVPIQDESELDDFMVEIDILAECRHSYIVGLYEAFFYDQALWIFIEFCAGGAVDDIIVDLDHGLSEPQIRCVSKQMFEALAFLHERGCIHRDIKAGNILLCPNGTIRLADFGVSAITTKNKQKRDTFIGTPYWMAPEVIVCETIKDVPYDFKADVWSAGITLVELADMNPPYHEMSPMRVVLKITKSEPPTLLYPSRWSKEFNNILSQCLTKDPLARPSAGEILSHPFIEGITDFRPLRVLYQERKAEVVDVFEDLREDADVMDREIQHVEETFSLPDSESPSSEAPSTTGLLPPERIISPMSESAMSSELGPSPTAMVSPEPTSPQPTAMVSPEPTSPQPTAMVSPEPTSPQPTAMDSPEPAAEVLTMLLPEPTDIVSPEPTDTVSPEPTDVIFLEPTSAELGPEPAVISLEPASSPSLGPEPIPLSPEPVSSANLGPEPMPLSPEQPNLGPEPMTFSPELGPEPVPLSPEPTHTAEEEEEEEESTSAVPSAARLKVQKPSSSETSSSTGGSPKGSLAEKNKNGASEYKYATLSRVRKFRVDGQVIQSRTTKIVDVKGNRTLRDNKRYQEMRKVDFRELKRLQREEMKEGSEFYARIKVEKDIQEKKFEGEKLELEKHYDIVLEQFNKRQKKEIEKLESQHVQQFRNRSKQLKIDQSKEQKRYKESQKEDEKLTLKRLESTLPKAGRKQELSRVKSEMHLKRQDKDRKFMTHQTEQFEMELQRLLEQQKDEMKTLELHFLDARQEHKRTHMNSLWEMEQRQKQDRHQQLKQQVREAFHMQRHQMQVRHQKEVELQARRDQFRMEELRQQHLLEKRQLPKRLKAEHKGQVAELRKAVRSKKVENSKEKFKKLDEQYVKRSQLETELMNERHDKELETLKAELEGNMRELHEIQNEKKMQLTQQETNKIKERDEQHTQELREWRAEIARKKQKVEEEFRKERMEQEMFYSHRPLTGSASVPSARGSVSIPNARVAMTPDRLEKAKSVAFDHIRAGIAEDKSSSREKRSSLTNLDEVVLGQPPLPARSVPNGNSS